MSVGGARVWHRGPLLLFIALPRCLLLITAQFQLPAVYQQRLMGEWLLEGRQGGCKKGVRKPSLIFFFSFFEEAEEHALVGARIFTRLSLTSFPARPF